MINLNRFFRLTGAIVLLFLSIRGSAGDSLDFRPYGLTDEPDFFYTGAAPSFSWKTSSEEHGWKQGACQILVTGPNGNSAWDSGKVESARQLFVPGPADAFAFDQTYTWKVRVWDSGGQASAWSEPSTFRMPLDPAVPWPGQWITYDYAPEAPMPLFRREFTLDCDSPVESARLYISGLGYYEASLNGRRIGDHVLDPAQSNYDDYAFYSSYEVSPGDLASRNVLGVMLGDGFFNQKLVWNPPSMSYGQPVLNAFLRIRYANGREQVVATDTAWRWHPGPVLEANIYKGETYDARRELPGWDTVTFDDTAWTAARAATVFPPRLVEQSIPPLRRIGELPAKRFTKQEEGRYIFDLGQNFAGWVRLKIQGRPGQKVTLRFAEKVYLQNGELNGRSTGVKATGFMQTDVYICRGDGEIEVYEPRFTCHGFRYVEVAGLEKEPGLDLVTGVIVHNDLASAGEFECSEEQINRLHRMAVWTLRSNLHGVLVDCPHRERCGWLGDAHAAAPSLIMNYDAHRFLVKYLHDIRSSARKEQPGHYIATYFKDRSSMIKPAGIPFNIAPGKRTSAIASTDWGSALTLLPWFIYQYYGDEPTLREFYPDMQRWMTWLDDVAVKFDGLVPHGIGDWCPVGGKMDTPIPLSSTAFYYINQRVMQRTATVLGKEEDAARYRAAADRTRTRFNQEFFNQETADYGSQTANAMALFEGLAPEDAREKVAATLARQINPAGNGFLNTGIFGLARVFPALVENGQEQIAFEVLNKRGNPSFARMWEFYEATTLWEVLPADNRYEENPKVNSSANHPMQSGFNEWFFRGIAGINFEPGRPAFERVVFRPWFVRDLTWARACYESPYGLVSSSWKREGGEFTWEFKIPPNTEADVHIPEVYPHQRVILPEGLEADDGIIRSVGSGSYRLKIVNDVKKETSKKKGNH